MRSQIAMDCGYQDQEMGPSGRAMAGPAAFGPCRHSIHILACNAYRHAKREGMEVDALIERAGLSRSVLRLEPDPRAVCRQFDFIVMVVAALGNQAFANLIFEDLDFREIGLLYYVMVSAGRLGQALRRLERYINAHNEGVLIRISNQEPVLIDFHCSEPTHAHAAYQLLALVILINDACRHLTGGALATTAVKLAEKSPVEKASLERIMSGKIETNAGCNRLELEAGSWWMPILGADHKAARPLPYRRRPGIAGTVSADVEELVVRLLPQGLARHRIVADKLNVSARTLARRLACEGYEFFEILDRARFVLAQRALANAAMPISRIACHVGYSEVAAFTRAFKRWSGMTPSAARRMF